MASLSYSSLAAERDTGHLEPASQKETENRGTPPCGTQRAKPVPRARMSRAKAVTHGRPDGGRLGAGNLGSPPPSTMLPGASMPRQHQH
jgi:hypothetical protein